MLLTDKMHNSKLHSYSQNFFTTPTQLCSYDVNSSCVNSHTHICEWYQCYLLSPSTATALIKSCLIVQFLQSWSAFRRVPKFIFGNYLSRSLHRLDTPLRPVLLGRTYLQSLERLKP